MQKAKQKFGLNRKGVISLMKKAGIRNLDSKNDLRGMKRHAERRPAPSGGGKPTGGPSVSTQPTPVRGPNTGGGGGGYNPYEGAYTSLVDQYNNLYANYTNAQNNAQNAIDRYQSTINDYRSQISGFQNQLSNYQGQVGNLTTQYQGALADNATIKQERDDFEKKFGEQSALYEQAEQKPILTGSRQSAVSCLVCALAHRLVVLIKPPMPAAEIFLPVDLDIAVRRVIKTKRLPTMSLNKVASPTAFWAEKAQWFR